MMIHSWYKFLSVLFFIIISLAQTSRFEKTFRESNGDLLVGSTIYIVNVHTSTQYNLTEDTERAGVYYHTAVPYGHYNIYVDGDLITTNYFFATVRERNFIEAVDPDGDNVIDGTNVIEANAIIKATNGCIESYGTGLNIRVDESTINKNGNNQLYIPNSGVNTNQLANLSVTSSKLYGEIPDTKLSTISSTDKVTANAIDKASDGCLQSVGTELTIRVDGSTISKNGSNQLYIPDGGVTSSKLASNITFEKVIFGGINTETLSGNKNLNSSSDQIQFLNAGGPVTRNVYLPTPAGGGGPTYAGYMFIIFCTGTTGGLSIRDQYNQQLVMIYYGEGTIVICNGDIWAAVEK